MHRLERARVEVALTRIDKPVYPVAGELAGADEFRQRGDDLVSAGRLVGVDLLHHIAPELVAHVADEGLGHGLRDAGQFGVEGVEHHERRAVVSGGELRRAHPVGIGLRQAIHNCCIKLHLDFHGRGFWRSLACGQCGTGLRGVQV